MLDPAVRLAEAQPWRGRAACRGRDPALWFPNVSCGTYLVEARAICATCPVATPCLAWALGHGERGTWAGTSEHQREQLLRGKAIQLAPDGPRLAWEPEAGLVEAGLVEVASGGAKEVLEQVAVRGTEGLTRPAPNSSVVNVALVRIERQHEVVRLTMTRVEAADPTLLALVASATGR